MSLLFENVSLSYEDAPKNTLNSRRETRGGIGRNTRTKGNLETQKSQDAPGNPEAQKYQKHLENPETPGNQEGAYALRNVNLEVEDGASLAIIGPSGCGKSSLLRVAAGLVAPTHGRMLINGTPLDKPRKQTALMLQNYGLLPWKTVFANAELGLRIQGIPADDREKRTNEALRRVGLEHCARKYPAQLSGGMQQRVALARALTQNADLLLMDEPMSALDALLREDLQDMLLSLWKEKSYTQILVTHSIEEAVYLGQRIAVMASCPGRVAACIENPLMGSSEFRNTQEFFNQCKAVRSALEGALRQKGNAETHSASAPTATPAATAATTAGAIANDVAGASATEAPTQNQARSTR